MPKAKSKRKLKSDKQMLVTENCMQIEDDSLISDGKTRRRTLASCYESPLPKRQWCKDSSQVKPLKTFESLRKYYSNAESKRSEEIQDSIYFDQVFSKLRNYHLGDFLDKHDIKEKFRAKMIDWMVEVLNIYQQKQQTLFKAVFILDLYYNSKTEKISLEELHLNGIVSMIIASKSEEVNFIKLEAAVNTIGRKKFTKEQIVLREMEILNTINFRTNFPTIYELLRCAFRFVKFDCSEADEYFQNSVFIITKMCLFSYELMVNLTLQELALFSIIIGYKLAKKVKGFGHDKSVS